MTPSSRPLGTVAHWCRARSGAISSVPSQKSLTYCDGSPRRWRRWASSEYSRYSLVGPPCQRRGSLAGIGKGLLTRDTRVGPSLARHMERMPSSCALREIPWRVRTPLLLALWDKVSPSLQERVNDANASFFSSMASRVPCRVVDRGDHTAVVRVEGDGEDRAHGVVGGGDERQSAGGFGAVLASNGQADKQNKLHVAPDQACSVNLGSKDRVGPVSGDGALGGGIPQPGAADRDRSGPPLRRPGPRHN